MHRTDAGRLVAFHRRCSIETTRLRFFTVHPELRPEELHRFTHVDHLDREAIVAVVDDEIVGVARYDRTPGGEADVAFVVEDAWQGRGLGALLFEALARCARCAGIDVLTAQTLAENRRMLAVFRHAGHRVRTRFEDGVVDVEIDLREAA